jgi:hypothetical protein
MIDSLPYNLHKGSNQVQMSPDNHFISNSKKFSYQKMNIFITSQSFRMANK